MNNNKPFEISLFIEPKPYDIDYAGVVRKNKVSGLTCYIYNKFLSYIDEHLE